MGSGPAGLAAARAFRERDENTPVLMITADRHPAYNRPPLTKDYLRGESERDELWLVEEDWYAEHDVELRLATRVSELDPGRRHVTITDGSKIRYRDLVLATGSRPKPLDVPGGDHPELILVRDLDSGERLRTLGGQTGTRVVVIGSGFIGCEAAASLATRGLDVTLVHSDDHPHTTRLGAEAGQRIGDWLTEHGVTRRTATRVSALERRGEGWLVSLDDGTTLSADAVVCGGGVEPNVELARQAGLPLDHGGIGHRVRSAYRRPAHLRGRRHRVRAELGRRSSAPGGALGRRGPARNDRRHRRPRAASTVGPRPPGSGPGSATGP